jgi:hypothetical protein
MSSREVAALLELVRAELEDEKFVNRTHGTRATYAENCHGPLCQKSERDRGRIRHAVRQRSKGKQVVRRVRSESQVKLDNLLNEIIRQHRRDRGLDELPTASGLEPAGNTP